VIDDSGTAIGEGVATESRACASEAQSKVVILLTDGDNNAGEVSPDFAAQVAKDHQIKLYTIQVGSGDEVDVEDGQDFLGNPHYSRQRFPVNPELLKRMAGLTGGEMYMATDGKQLVDSMQNILNQLEKTKFEAPRSSFEDLFPLLLIPGVALIGLEFVARSAQEVSVILRTPGCSWARAGVALWSDPGGGRLPRARRSAASAMRSASTPRHLRPCQRRAYKGVFMVLAVALAFVAAARPQYGKERQLVRPSKSTSSYTRLRKSMYAQDIEPSRIFRAREEVAELVQVLPGVRWRGRVRGRRDGLPVTSDGAAWRSSSEGRAERHAGRRHLHPKALDQARELLRRDPRPKTTGAS
jgi:hypothetical protein